MNQEIDCDIAIIGAGSAGLSLAAGCAQLGVRVILCEQDKMGGDCLNTGCVPSKALLAAAKHYWQALHNDIFGTVIEKSHLDFQRVMQHVHDTIASIAPNDSVERFESLGVKVIKGKATFVDNDSIRVGVYRVTAKRFVVATGSSAAIPPIENLQNVGYLTNETIFDLTELPEHLLVIGGGPIGCELAQAFAMLGSKVTLLEGLSILNKDDAACVKIVEQSLSECGIKIYQHAQVKRVGSTASGIRVEAQLDNESVSFDGSHLLVAVGRKPNIDALNCEAAGIEINRGGIIVNDKLRTSNKKIYAIGDVIGQLQFTHAANYHASIVLKNILFKLPAKVDYRAMPWVTYTYPELAHVGMTLADCKKQQIIHSVHELSYEDNDRALAEGVVKGKIIIIVNKKAQVLGVSIVGQSAGELILPWGMLVREKKTLRSLTDMTIAYPTLSELSKRVASQYYSPKLFSSKVKKIVKFLMKF